MAGERWVDTVGIHGPKPRTTGGLVFTTTIGTPLDGSQVTAAFLAALERAGIRRIRFHDLRHSCASILGAQGVSPREIVELLGHSTITLTMNT